MSTWPIALMFLTAETFFQIFLFQNNLVHSVSRTEGVCLRIGHIVKAPGRVALKKNSKIIYDVKKKVLYWFAFRVIACTHSISEKII